MQKLCVRSTYVYCYRRSYGWCHAHRQLTFPGVCSQLGHNCRTRPELPHLKHPINGQIVLEWLLGVEPARVHFQQTAGPRPLLPPWPRGRPVPRIPGGTTRSWDRSAPARRLRALPRHRKRPCMRCRSRRRHWRKSHLRNRRWRGGGGGMALVALPRPNRGLGGNGPVGSSSNPPLPPIAFNSLS